MTTFENPAAVPAGLPAEEEPALCDALLPAPNQSFLTTVRAILSAPLRLYRYAIVDSLLIIKRHGLRELLRQRGWKFVAAVVAYYLVRDILLYLVLPFVVARRIS